MHSIYRKILDYWQHWRGNMRCICVVLRLLRRIYRALAAVSKAPQNQKATKTLRNIFLMQSDDLQQVENAETADTTSTTTIATTQALNKKNTKNVLFLNAKKNIQYTHTRADTLCVYAVYIEKIFAKSFSFFFRFSFVCSFEPSHKNTMKKVKKTRKLKSVEIYFMRRLLMQTYTKMYIKYTYRNN